MGGEILMAENCRNEAVVWTFSPFGEAAWSAVTHLCTVGDC